MTKKLGRRFEVESKRPGKINFNLIDENGKLIAKVMATPYRTMILSAVSTNICLTQNERVFCQVSAKKTLGGFY